MTASNTKDQLSKPNRKASLAVCRTGVSTEIAARAKTIEVCMFLGIWQGRNSPKRNTEEHKDIYRPQIFVSFMTSCGYFLSADLRSFSWIPPNPPFDITATTSPSRISGARCSTIASASATNAGRFSRRVDIRDELLDVRAAFAISSCVLGVKNAGDDHVIGVRERLFVTAPRKSTSREDLERGSNTAISRWPSYFCRRALSVSSTAVG